MKSKLLLLLSAAAAVAVASFSGCSTMDSLYERRVETIPGQILSTNIVYKTNIVEVQAASTNATTGEITPPVIRQTVTPQITYDYAPPTTVTNLVPRAAIEGAIQGTGLLPVPWAGTAAVALGWLYSAYAAMRNKKVGVALVKSVQAGRQFLQSTPEGQKLDAQFKDILAKEQSYSGVVAEVRTLLDRYVPAHTQTQPQART